MRVPDALFPTDNELGIPLLHPDRQGVFVDLPVRGWGSVSRYTSMRGTWHFYVDDDKFQALWKHPDTPLKTKAYNCVEANYTTDDQMPFAVAAYRIYKKRWLARFWQEHGMNIFVDLNVADPYQDLNMYGVPKGWKSYATSASDSKVDLLVRQTSLATTWAGGKIRMLVYGGGKKVAALCGANDWVHIKDARNEAREGQDG
jgi:hypothetical protein